MRYQLILGWTYDFDLLSSEGALHAVAEAERLAVIFICLGVYGGRHTQASNVVSGVL